MNNNKTVILHDFLNTKDGGAEYVLREMLKAHPEADIYTLVYNKLKFGKLAKSHKIHSTYLSSLPRFILNKPYLLLPFLRRALRSINLEGYDKVIINHSAFIKNCKHPDDAIVYINSPARMLWDSWPGYLEKFNLPQIIKIYIAKISHKLRIDDYYTNNGIIVANSAFIKKRIEKYYRPIKVAHVINPPIPTLPDVINDISLINSIMIPEKFLLCLGNLAEYKKIDEVVKAYLASSQKVPLLIAGEGQQYAKIKELIINNSNIILLGRITDNEKWWLYSNAEFLVFPSIEDFGITPLEAMRVGLPTLAHKQGGVADSINKYGGLTYQHSVIELTKQLNNLFKYSKEDRSILSKKVLNASSDFNSSESFNKQLADLW